MAQVTFHGSLGHPVAHLSPGPEINWFPGHAYHPNAPGTNAPLILLIHHPFIRCLLGGPGAGNTEMIKMWFLGFPAGAVVENLPANAGDMGSSPGLGRSHMPWSN